MSGVGKQRLSARFQVGSLDISDPEAKAGWSLGLVRLQVTVAAPGGAQGSCRPAFVSLTRVWSCCLRGSRLTSRMGGAASSFLSDTHPQCACNVLMFSGCALMETQ